MRRRDFTIGLLVAGVAPTAWAQEPAKQRRVAIVVPAGAIADISETSSDPLSRRLYQPFFEELRRLGDVEGQDLIVERYSGEGRPEGPADLARRSSAGARMSSSPSPTPQHWRSSRPPARSRSSGWGLTRSGSGLVTNLAHPGGNITGVSRYDLEFYGKLLQILKEVVPSASRLGWLAPRRIWEGAYGQVTQRAFSGRSRPIGCFSDPDAGSGFDRI